MASLIDTRRYLTDFDADRVGHVVTDVLVIGSGVAGARAAIEAAQFGQVTLLTKADFNDSCTQHAQGGIAAALSSHDSCASHFQDTIRVGAGLCDHEAVHRLVDEGPQAIKELINWGMNLDRTGDDLALTREGGHSEHRIVHADGDQTGRALATTLRARLMKIPAIRVFEHCFLIDLITVDETCVGAVTYHAKHGHQLIWAAQTILASGGCGQLWRETTNPSVATGDGVATAFRAQARLRDMEMVQFHPTTLYVAGAGRSLISEAVRGEGAYLIDRDGYRFMSDHHTDGELAPRDIVSRAIHEHLRGTRSHCVFLDVRHLSGFRERFPAITRRCAEFQIDVTRDLIPVRPSAHYLIGGMDVSLDGRSSVDGLLGCGEVACTGVHGANRLASNSLLEGLVFGKVAGETAGRLASGAAHRPSVRAVQHKRQPSQRTSLDLADIRNSLKSLMWRNVGITRRGDRLTETCEILDFWTHYTLDKTFDRPTGWEVQNELTVARVIAGCAQLRTESVGVHFRSDAAGETASTNDHVVVERHEDGTVFERRGPSAASR